MRYLCYLIFGVYFLGSCTEKKEIIAYYDDGTVRIVCPIDTDSLAHGLVQYNYKSGGVKVVQEFKHGVIDGIYQSYYESGNMKSEGNKYENEKVGSFTYYYDANPKVVHSKFMYEHGKEKGMFSFFSEQGEVTSFGYKEKDTTLFYASYNSNNELIDIFSEAAILPKRQAVAKGEPFKIDFKVYGDESKKTDIKYLLINFMTDDTIKKGVMKDYVFNTKRKINFNGIESGKYFIDFYVPMLDSVFIMTNAIIVGIDESSEMGQ